MHFVLSRELKLKYSKKKINNKDTRNSQEKNLILVVEVVVSIAIRIDL